MPISNCASRWIRRTPPTAASRSWYITWISPATGTPQRTRGPSAGRGRKALRNAFLRGFAILQSGADGGGANGFGDAQELQQLELDPGQVELIPRQTVARRGGVGMVIVVPAFAEGDQRDPPVVARIVAWWRSGGNPTCASRNSPAKWRAAQRRCAGSRPTGTAATRQRRATPAPRNTVGTQ